MNGRHLTIVWRHNLESQYLRYTIIPNESNHAPSVDERQKHPDPRVTSQHQQHILERVWSSFSPWSSLDGNYSWQETPRIVGTERRTSSFEDWVAVAHVSRRVNEMALPRYLKLDQRFHGGGGGARSSEKEGVGFRLARRRPVCNEPTRPKFSWIRAI